MMTKIIKKAMSVLTIAVLLVSMVCLNVAAEENLSLMQESGAKVITSERFFSELKEEYQRYGMSLEVVESNENLTYTVELLEEAKIEAQAIGEGFVITYEMPQITTIPSTQTQMAGPRMMPMYYLYTCVWGVSNNKVPIGELRLETSCYGQYDAQNNSVISILQFKTIEKKSVNLDTYSFDYEQARQNAPTVGKITWLIGGTARFSWTDPLTQSTFAATKEISGGDTFVAGNYGI